MPAIKLDTFGGMIPATDPRLLANSMSASVNNVWLYAGNLEGIREPKPVFTCTSPSTTKRAFRIPKQFLDKDHIVDSYWLEFPYLDVDVLKAPTANDTYERFYWAMDGGIAFEPPRYNTKARIAAGQPAFYLGIPAPSVAPAVSTVAHKYTLKANTTAVFVTPGLLELYYGTRYAVDYDTFISRYESKEDPNLKYTVTGFAAALKRKTSNSSLRVTIADDGTRTIGIPTRTPDPVEPDPSVNPRISVSRSYVYTWVSAYGEEGPPSPATTFTAYEDDPWTIRVTAPTSSDTTNRNLSKVRIYRTVTSSAGVATYFFVAELNLSETSYTDTQPDTDVSGNNQLASLGWIAPPTDLKGISAMPNGIFVGFRSNEVWFSEPYRPHAWPAEYSLSVDFNIVGIGVIGQTVVICTQASTYAATGINPASMSMSKISIREPCLSRGSIVSTPLGVFYASPNGLMLATPAQVQNATNTMFTKDKWLSYLQVNRLRSALLGTSYYTMGTSTEGCFDSAFEPTAFEQKDYSGSYTGGIIDGSDPRVAFINLTSTTPTTNVFNDPWTNEVLVLRDGIVYQIDITSTQPRSLYTWKSKVFQLAKKQNLEALKIYFDNPEGLTSLGYFKLWADGKLVANTPIVSSGQMMRLPSGFYADYWQLEITTRLVITNIQMATSARELASV